MLQELIIEWLRGIPAERRRIFLLRYFDCESTGSIAVMIGKSEGSVRTMLSRLRAELRAALIREGYTL